MTFDEIEHLRVVQNLITQTTGQLMQLETLVYSNKISRSSAESYLTILTESIEAIPNCAWDENIAEMINPQIEELENLVNSLKQTLNSALGAN